MNLPVKENAVVWASTSTEFKAIHKGNQQVVLGDYTDALKAQGWKLDNFDDRTSKDMYFVDMSKGTEKLNIQIYDFQGTGVIIKKS